MFPLMVEDKNMYVYACDFSHRAVQFVKVSTAVGSNSEFVIVCFIALTFQSTVMFMLEWCLYLVTSTQHWDVMSS